MQLPQHRTATPDTPDRTTATDFFSALRLPVNYICNLFVLQGESLWKTEPNKQKKTEH